MIKIIGPALVVAALALMPSVASAAAAPGLQLKQDTASGVTQVQGGDRIRRKEVRRRSYNRGFRAGQRYDNAPRGWRRHSSRPRDWRTRGCVIVGPLWFCP